MIVKSMHALLAFLSQQKTRVLMWLKQKHTSVPFMARLCSPKTHYPQRYLSMFVLARRLSSDEAYLSKFHSKP